MKKCVRLAILTALICIFGSHGLVHAEIVSPGGKRDGERFTETIMLEGMEETVRFEHTINDELGIEMDYDYESLDRFSESDCERFISSYDDPEEPQNYLEVRYSAENVDTICAIITDTLSSEYDIIREPYTLDHAGPCVQIEATEGGKGIPYLLQTVYVIPKDDGCIVATAHYTIESAEGFGARFRYILNTLVVK